MPEWFETLDDRLWLRPDEMGVEEARFIKKALRLRKGQKVLDAPCGAGRIAVHLAYAGCLITGVDLRRQFVDRARTRFRKVGVSGDFRVMDLRNIDFTDEFHGIYNWFGSFGYFSEVEDAEVIRSYTRALRNGGRLLIEQVNRERILRHFIAEREEDWLVMRNDWQRDRQRLVTRRIIGGVDDPRNRSSMRLYTPGQMRDLFNQSGLLVEDIFGFGEGGEQFSRSSRRMVVVGRKP